jgi:peptide/nickel transport system substrate-binding protein
VAAIRGYPKSVSTTIDSAGAGSTAGLREVSQLVSVGLTIMGGEGHLIPRLAESVPTLENGLWKLSPDGRMETTWKIREGAQWQDGAPFTAQDLVFTARIAQDRELAIVMDSSFSRVESLEAPDARTLIVRWH